MRTKALNPHNPPTPITNFFQDTAHLHNINELHHITLRNLDTAYWNTSPHTPSRQALLTEFALAYEQFEHECRACREINAWVVNGDVMRVLESVGVKEERFEETREELEILYNEYEVREREARELGIEYRKWLAEDVERCKNKEE
ncbi:hypothetical protein K504DRAFT_508480 [Pleomassaria siparia CBS 279.74]|uniref:Uncharacterized protein n=1 Tax=Pleomassaria siparia CBS 279.74 TaxID=1314801 RepID=A0A6G1JS50_9PLEO|nr:hypothetical protein K504DRAFT_508480 [Pleomassaria siparia CBS 279.74]